MAAKTTDSVETQYIYIVQALLEPSKCKIGRTNDLEKRLKDYNSITGKPKENLRVLTYLYLSATLFALMRFVGFF